MSAPQIHACFKGGHPETQAPGWWIATAYEADYVERLKAAVPLNYRHWDNEGTRWWIADEYAEALLEVHPGFAAFYYQGRLL